MWPANHVRVPEHRSQPRLVGYVDSCFGNSTRRSAGISSVHGTFAEEVTAAGRGGAHRDEHLAVFCRAAAATMSVRPPKHDVHRAPNTRSEVRVEDEPLLNGRAQFVADIVPANCLHLVFVRSPIARATLRRINVDAALNSPGVRLVLTSDSVEGCTWPQVNPVFSSMRPIVRSLLAKAHVDAVGEAVAAVVADTEFGARDGADRIQVDYGAELPLPDADAARHGQAIYADWPDNVAFEHRWRHGDCDSYFAAAKHVVHMHLDMPRVAAVALETRGAVAQWDAKSRSLTAWIPTQTPHRTRAELARILGLEPAKVRVIAPCVGGAFGSKASIYPEDVLVALAAMRLDQPVRWIATRNEDFVATSHGRGASLRADAVVDEHGRFQALRAELVFPLGFWAPYSAAVPAWNAGRILPGPYHIDAVDIHVTGVVTNAAPVGILRGAGRPEAAMIMERLMDEAARVLRIDPADVRRTNLIPATAFPYSTPTGELLDSGNYQGLLEHALDVAKYRQICSDQHSQDTDRLMGVGICLYVEPCGKGWESACVSRESSGRILVACGTSAQGQGHQTTFARIAAACLDVPMSQIDVIEGDTATSPEGIGALASRSVSIGGSAVKAAAEQLRDQLCMSNAPPIARIEASVVYTAPTEAWGSGCCIAVVSIDRSTGDLKIIKLLSVEDCGTVIEPELARGQLEGGLAQGLGHVLREKIVYDEQGQLLTGSLMDYALPRADDVPEIEVYSLPTETKANLLGAKGIGEAGCIAAPAAILNAAHAAVRSANVRSLTLPLTSESIWQALRHASNEPRLA